MKLKVAGVMLAVLCAHSAWADKVSLKNESDKVSYAIGVQMGQDFKQQGISINPAIFSQGLSDGVSGATPQLTAQQVQEVLMNFRKELIAKKQAEFKTVSETNLKQGEKFLADNKTKPGVVTLSDGLQYKVLGEGKGAQPKEGESITVNYSGKFVDGKEFDSSYQRGKPATFVLSKDLIPAWVEALKLMKTGSTWELYVPAKLGYGDHGVGPIGPNQVLIFKIELLSVAKK